MTPSSPDDNGREAPSRSVPADLVPDTHEPASPHRSDLPAEQALALAIVGARTTADLRGAVLSGLCAATGARWTAWYERDESGEYLLGASAGAADSLPATLPAESVSTLVAGRCAPFSLNADAPPPGMPVDTSLAAPLGLDLAPALLLLGEASDAADTLALLGQTSLLVEAAHGVAREMDDLREQVSVDYLTGCFNRRGFEDALRAEISRAQRYDRPVSLVLLDLDRFKSINDRLGHPIGDHALRVVGRILQSTFRTSDVVCRFGGDEFALIFPETAKDETHRLAERLRIHIRSLFPDAVLNETISASLGVAAFPADAPDGESLVRAADRALYQAKFRGRNQMSLA